MRLSLNIGKEFCVYIFVLITGYFFSAMMFCSTPDCQVIVKMKGADRFGIDKFGVEINCDCGEALCSSCGNAWHDPVNTNTHITTMGFGGYGISMLIYIYMNMCLVYGDEVNPFRVPCGLILTLRIYILQ